MSIVYIGMDVHKDSYSLCAYMPEFDAFLGETKCASEPKNVEKFIDNLREHLEDDVEFVTGYEAGVLGYSLHNTLEKMGITCKILAPSTMSKSSKDLVVKNDRRDAKMIAKNLANKTYKAVYVPDDEDVEIKEFVRLRKNACKARGVIKKQINAFVLRHGFNYQRSKWTVAHIKWLKQLELSVILRETLNEMLLQYYDLNDRIERFDARIEAFSQQERYVKPVQQMRCLKGVDTITAMTIQVETSDFSRFPNAKAYAAYLGLIPSDHSSGPHVRLGAITKQGNGTIRTTLIEAANALVRSNIGYKSKKLKARQKGMDANVIAYADKAADRLGRKYRRMIRMGKPHNVAVTAIARELACYIWGIETGNIAV